MDNQKNLKDSAHLLDDLESIRQLLGDDSLQPPLLTDAVSAQEEIPLLFDVVNGKLIEADAPMTSSPHDKPAKAEPTAAPVDAIQPASAPPRTPGPDDLLHLDSELRAAAQLIMQDVINDFAPHIENEIKRRLEVRMERLLAAAGSGKL